MPYYVVNPVEGKKMPQLFGPYISEERASSYKDKNCGSAAIVLRAISNSKASILSK